jgi:transcription initiation factor TFIIIB Brf1 subunit/transcription initiation factor TFIIB
MTKHPDETKRTARSKDILLLGTKTGKCDICKETKKLLLLRYGFTLCGDCLIICTSILEQLTPESSEQETKEKSTFPTSGKNSQTSISKTSTGRKTKSYPKIETRED